MSLHKPLLLCLFYFLPVYIVKHDPKMTLSPLQFHKSTDLTSGPKAYVADHCLKEKCEVQCGDTVILESSFTPAARPR